MLRILLFYLEALIEKRMSMVYESIDRFKGWTALDFLRIIVLKIAYNDFF